MAVSTVETIIANPAGKKRRRNVARKMSLKQKLHFGTARQRKSAEESLKRSRAAKRAAKHRKNAGARSFRKQKKAIKKMWREHGIRGTVHKGKKLPKILAREMKNRAKRKRKHNPGEIIALTAMNPAKGRSMARTKKHHHRASSHRAGHRRTHHRMNRMNAPRRHQRRRHNPGQQSGVGAMVRSAAWAGVGFVGSKAITQAVMGASNTGALGYLGNAVTTGILSFGAQMFTKNRWDAFMVGVGGVLNIIGRIIADNSLLGSYSAQLGMGDYLVANWWVPQRLDGQPFSLSNQGYDMSWLTPSLPAPVAVSSAAPPGMGYLPAPIPNLYGNDLY